MSNISDEVAYIDSVFPKPEDIKTCTACTGSGYYDTDGSPACGACDGTSLEVAAQPPEIARYE